MSRHRVCLLGTIELTDENGQPIKPPNGMVQLRLLVALALRTGEACSNTELVRITWDDDYREAEGLQGPVAHLRSKVPIPNKGRNEDFYRLDLPRRTVDAIDFIDSARSAREPSEIDRLLALWRGDPVKLYPFIPPLYWRPLERALATLLSTISAWSSVEQGRLSEWGTFCDRFPDRVPQRTAEPRQKKRLLVVDDKPQVVTQVTALLSDFDCLVANTLDEAMKILYERGSQLDGAIVDLHLTDDLDEGGLGILAYLRSQLPDVPRLLLTRTPPKGSVLDLRKRFGLFSILIKSGDYSPMELRRDVEAMLGSSGQAIRRKAIATFDSHAATMEAEIKWALTEARKRLRKGNDAAVEDLAHWAARLEDFDNESEELRASLAECDPDAASETVSTFVESQKSRQPVTLQL
ncbi:MAG: hypothetical protein M3083_07040 [Actinomycetota bacterium]|nr:hypothetical protein [Actinomycetota bacterium]MDQ6946779.1 hypothetical protein [Actinomycetota bacterium]